MNPLNLIFPLRLRALVYFHLPFGPWRDGSTFPLPARLALLPSRLAVLHPTDHGHKQIGWLGFYDLPLSTAISRMARKGGMFVDVGANAGYFTALWVGARAANKAIAVEASPRNHSMLRCNVSEMMGGGRVRICECAVGQTSGEMRFEIGPPDQTGWGGLSKKETAESVMVTVKTLDELLHEVEQISAVKIDTEGADTWVIQGARRLLQERRIQHIFFEKNQTRMGELGIDLMAADTFLATFGYEVRRLDGDQFHAFLA